MARMNVKIPLATLTVALTSEPTRFEVNSVAPVKILVQLKPLRKSRLFTRSRLNSTEICSIHFVSVCT